MKTEDREPGTPDTPPVGPEIEGAKKIMASFVLVRKHFSLYPEGHALPAIALEGLHALLAAHLENHGELRVDVEKDRLLAQGEVVLSGGQEEGALPFTLFRDGIRWLAFTDGIEQPELRELLRIIIRYSFLTDDAQGDIVTSLWESQLPHVRYEVSEFAWGAEDGEPDPASGSPVKERFAARASRPADRPQVQAPPIERGDVECTAEDDVRMKDLVMSDEGRPWDACFDALFDSLIEYREQESYDLILRTLSEELGDCLAQMRFDVACRLLSNLRAVQDACRAGSPASARAIEGFYHSISNPSFLVPLQDVWSEVETRQMGPIRQILGCLQPVAIGALGRMLAKEQMPGMRQMLVETIVSLASRDVRPLEAMLKSNDEKLMQGLVQVIASLEGEQPVKILQSLVRHPSEKVRQEALRGLFRNRSANVREVFRLIDDPDESIRKAVLKHLALSRDRGAEKFLLSYLESPRTRERDFEHVMECFAALGQCGSSRSIPFLSKTLFHRAWMPGFWNRAYRKGAAEALSVLGTTEAREILKRARHSPFPGLRKIARRAD